MKDAQFLFVVEYPCEKFCRVEVDLSEVDNLRFTLAQMQRRADNEHKRLHPAPPKPASDELSATFRAPAR